MRAFCVYSTKRVVGRGDLTITRQVFLQHPIELGLRNVCIYSVEIILYVARDMHPDFYEFRVISHAAASLRNLIIFFFSTRPTGDIV